jgi:hypothetical protein
MRAVMQLPQRADSSKVRPLYIRGDSALGQQHIRWWLGYTVAICAQSRTACTRAACTGYCDTTKAAQLCN